MIALDTRLPVRWSPPWRGEEERPPVYLLRAGSVIERETLEGELAGEYRAAAVFPFQLRAMFAAGVQAMIGESDPADAARLVALAAQRDGLRNGEILPADEAELLTAAEAVLTEHYPAYRGLVAQAQRREALAPVVAFRKLCVGWENIAIPFARDWAGVTPEAMGGLDPFELRVAGRAAYNLCYAAHQSGN